MPTVDRTEYLRQMGVRERTSRPSADGHTEGSARELLAASLGSDPFERLEDLREAGRRKAKATGVAYQLDHERHAVLARLSTEYARTHANQNLSEAKLDRLARADDRYQKHLEGTAAAMEEKELAESEYWAMRSELEWDRAAIAHINALSRLEEPA